MTQKIPGYGLNLEEKMLTLLLITPDTNRNKDICPLHQLFITLRFYARGAFQNCLGDHLINDRINISQPSVPRVIAKITRSITRRSNTEIKTSDLNESIQVCSDFYGMVNFLRVVVL